MGSQKIITIKAELKKNPQIAKSFLWTIISSVLFIFLPNIAGLIALVVSDRFLVKAKKEKEDKKLRKIANIVIFIPVLIWVIKAILWAFGQIYVINDPTL